MSSESDTDSDGDLECIPPSDIPAFSLTIPSDVCRELGVIRAVDLIKQIEFGALENASPPKCNDSDVDNSILSAYATISTFFSQIGDRAAHLFDDRMGTLLAFHSLCDVSFLKSLFLHRARCYRLAARSFSLGNSISNVVCWVDVVLAKLGEATLDICTGLVNDEVDSSLSFGPLKSKQEDDAIQGASQLPENWDALPLVIDSKESSPAAQRLALRLLFASCVLDPHLADNHHCSTEHKLFRDTVFQRIQSYLDIQRDLCNLDELPARERISYAILVSLYTTMLKTQIDHTTFRPHTYSVLLNVIQSIMVPKHEHLPHAIIAPLENLDVAQCIIVRYGHTVPWSWSVWNEQWLSNSDVVVLLTVTWLHNFDQPSVRNNNTEETDEAQLPEVLFDDPSASASILLQILSKVDSAATPDINFTSSTLDVLFKACWAVIEVKKQLTTDCGDSEFEQALTRSFAKLFLSLNDNEIELQIKDLIIEGLTFVDASHRRKGLQELFQAGDLFLKLDTVITRCKNTPPTHQDYSIILSTRLCLNFLSILWNDDVYDNAKLRTYCPFLLTLSNRLKDADDDVRDSVLDSLLMLLAVFKRITGPNPPKAWTDETVWKLACQLKADRLCCSAAFSHFILASTREAISCDALICAVAWDRLRDVFLFILAREFYADEASLAIAVSPVICRALIELIRCSSPGVVNFIRQSPWTITLRAELKRLCDDNNGNMEQSECIWDQELMEYRSILRITVEKQGAALLRLLDFKKYDKNEEPLELDEMSLAWRLCFFGPYSRLLLL